MRKLFLVGILVLGLPAYVEAQTNYHQTNYYKMGQHIGKNMAENKELYFPKYNTAKGKCEQWWKEGLSDIPDHVVIDATRNERALFMDGCKRAYDVYK